MQTNLESYRNNGIIKNHTMHYVLIDFKDTLRSFNGTKIYDCIFFNLDMQYYVVGYGTVLCSDPRFCTWEHGVYRLTLKEAVDCLY